MKKKVLALSVCAVVLVAASVMGTLAYLTSVARVANVFTFGKVVITMDEAKVDKYGNLVDENNDGVADERNTGNTYHLIPGHTYVKDPTVHIAADSEESWLFVEVTNDIAELEDSANTIAAQMAAKGWTLIDAQNNRYVYKDKVNASQDIVVFDSFKIATDADVSKATADKTITVIAYAIQADGFATYSDAYSALTESIA